MKLLTGTDFVCPDARSFTLFSDIGGFDVERLSVETRLEIIKRADEAWKTSISPLTACDYRRFSVNGNRSEYENAYFSRREAVYALALGQKVCGDNRYLDRLMDFVWAICEETSWVIPAHSVAADGRLLDKSLPDAFGMDIPYIDLYSASTAATLAFAYMFMDGTDDGLGTVVTVRDRIKFEIERRIITPFLTKKMRWAYVFVNNWMPWIVGNVLTATAITVEDARRTEVIKKSLEYLDIFTETYGEDGGCNEGAAYWSLAGGAWFDALELLYDMTGGGIDVFNDPFTASVGEYIGKVHISGNYFVTVADSHAQLVPDYRHIARFGRRCESKRLEDFGKWGMLHTQSKNPPQFSHSPYRRLKDLFEDVPYEDVACPDFGSCVLPDLQFAVLRDGTMTAAIKGGHNNESHNHNDVGNFILYCDGKPVIVDVGVGTYTRDTFNERRYTIWTMRSDFHNVAEIGDVLQQNGEQYRADRFECAGNRVTVCFPAAYPDKAQLDEYTRTLELADQKLVVTDRIRISGEKKTVFNFITPEIPLIRPDDTIELSNGIKLKYTSGLKAEVEPIELSDLQLVRDWRTELLYRIRLSVTADNIRAVFTFCK